MTASSGPHLALRLPGSLSDLVLATPVLEAAERAVREEGPARTSSERPPWRRLSVLVPRGLQALLEAEPDIGRTHGGAELVQIGFPRDERRALERLAPDAVLLLDHGFGSAWAARQARVPLRAGLARGLRRALLTHAVLPPTQGGRSVPVASGTLSRDLAGLVDLRPEGLTPRLGMREESRAAVTVRLQGLGLLPGRPHVLLAPAAGARSSEAWPVGSWVELAARLSRHHGWSSVVLAMNEEEESVAAELSRLSLSAGGTAADVCVLGLGERELDQLVPLVASSAAVIAGCRGPQAIAAALGIPSVSLIGPRPSVEWMPPGPLAGLAAARPMPECAPCLEPSCPLGHVDCMTLLPVDSVLEVLDGLLQRLEEERELEEGRLHRERGVAT